jgi:hypothetical protein
LTAGGDLGHDGRAVIARRLRTQAGSCGHLGSALYADLMERAAVDVEAGGIFRQVFAGHEDDPGPDAIALRLFGGTHRLALAGHAPDLAAHYPSTGGDGDHDAAWTALVATVTAHLDWLRASFAQPPQTNEVGRSAGLAPGFLAASARGGGLPLRLLEVGASGGLNLRWDHYRYDVPGGAFGPATSPLVFPASWFEAPWPEVMATGATVVERRGCDRAPVDVTTDSGRLTLLSYVWPDQADRFARLQAAMQVASQVPALIDRADAVAWVADRLASSTGGVTTVVFHSIFIQYLTERERAALSDVIGAAGRRARADAPLGWLRYEPNANAGVDVRLTMWPGGEEELIATAGFHGPPVKAT